MGSFNIVDVNLLASFHAYMLLYFGEKQNIVLE